MANIITTSRFIFAIALLFIKKNSVLFFIVYFVCALTDIGDGFVARKTQTVSERGARLDSFSDMVFFLVVLIIVSDVLFKDMIFIFLIVFIIVIKVLSLLVVFYKYQKIGFIHTLANKITGCLLFFLPCFLKINYITYFIGFFALFSAVEEFMIHLKSHHLDFEKKSLFIK